MTDNTNNTTTENKVKAHAEINNSKCDINGNRYFCAVITRTSDGARAGGQITGGESNVTYSLRQFFGDWGSFIYTRVELPIREYNKLTKNMPYLGCTPDEINKNITDQWNNYKA